MRKTGVMFAVLLMFSSIFPSTLFANTYEDVTEIDDEVTIQSEEESIVEVMEKEELLEDDKIEIEVVEAEETQGNIQQEESVEPAIEEVEVPQVPEEEVNEFGIKKGTMLYGEDISELSEWELQYVPEGMRDGSVEEEHPVQTVHENERKIYPNVNNYIQSKKFKTANIKYDHKSFFTKFNYRGGYGKVEGIVAHETANPRSNIAGEIAYMSRNHKNAFVHAFVDHSQIIEIHPTDLGAWGAGRFANQRFVHVELVQVHSFDAFARSINNYSEYIAHVLYQYNLGVTSAEVSGNGSLWSHAAVTKHLGGTTHGDPHGYFAKWGYNWTEFVRLVKSKYDALAEVTTKSTSKLGHIRNGNVKIYRNLDRNASTFNAGSTYTNAVYYIKQEGRVGGQLYYLISKNSSSTKGVVGWVRAQDLSVQNHVGVDQQKKTLYFTGKGSAYNTAWGGSKNQTFKSLAAYQNQQFHVHLTEKVGNVTWYRGTLNGRTIWVDSAHLGTKKEVSTSKLGHIQNGQVNIQRELGNSSTQFSAGSTYTNAVYYIKKEAHLNGQLYYLISRNSSSTKGVVGWVRAQDLSVQNHVGVDNQQKTFYIKGTGSAYNTAWGGSKNYTHKSLVAYQNERFNVHLTEKVGNNTWYRGTLGGRTVWIHSKEVDFGINSSTEAKTSKLGHINNGSADRKSVV